LGIVKKIKQKLIGDCPKDLIPLIGKPKQFREVATKVLIDCDHKLNVLSLEMKLAIGLNLTILTVLVLRGLEVI